MTNEKNPVGRPPIDAEDKKRILSKLEPYLKSGLSVRKSLLEAQVSNATFYRLLESDEEFRERINTFRQFTSVLLNNALVSELQAIMKKQNGWTDPKTNKYYPPEPLNKADREFLWKFALSSNSTKEEFGERKDVNLFDPEAEIQKVKGLLEEHSSKQLPPLLDDYSND